MVQLECLYTQTVDIKRYYEGSLQVDFKGSYLRLHIYEVFSKNIDSYLETSLVYTMLGIP